MHVQQIELKKGNGEVLLMAGCGLVELNAILPTRAGGEVYHCCAMPLLGKAILSFFSVGEQKRGWDPEEGARGAIEKLGKSTHVEQSWYDRTTYLHIAKT